MNTTLAIVLVVAVGFGLLLFVVGTLASKRRARPQVPERFGSAGTNPPTMDPILGLAAGTLSVEAAGARESRDDPRTRSHDFGADGASSGAVDGNDSLDADDKAADSAPADQPTSGRDSSGGGFWSTFFGDGGGDGGGCDGGVDGGGGGD